MGIKPQFESKTRTYIDYFIEQYSENIDINTIADNILEKYNIMVDANSLYALVLRHKNLFENIRRDSRTISSETNRRNRALKSKHRLTIKEYLDDKKKSRIG